jgi:hypothetical protein
LRVQSALEELLRLLNQQTGADPVRVVEVRDVLMGDLRELSQ